MKSLAGRTLKIAENLNQNWGLGIPEVVAVNGIGRLQ
jgi:hypothetical protein